MTTSPIKLDKKEKVTGSFDAYCDHVLYNGTDKKEKPSTLESKGSGKYIKTVHDRLDLPDILAAVLKVPKDFTIVSEITISGNTLRSSTKSSAAWSQWIEFTEIFECTRGASGSIEYSISLRGTTTIPSALHGIILGTYSDKRITKIKVDIKNLSKGTTKDEIPQ